MKANAPLKAKKHKRKHIGTVTISKRKYEGMKETLYLLSDPDYAKDLLEGIAEANADKFVEHELIED